MEINSGNVKVPISEVKREKEKQKIEARAAHNLCRFIKHNQKLLHFDLCHTGLNKKILLDFGNALRKAKSLLCLHLSGNPGIDTDVKKQIHERAHCMPVF